jgi:citrate-Mg2+:H+ or citrate-Ca2+:H+ symporter, CitMHS family
MLAFLGFASILLVLALIMSRRLSPLVALVVVPTVAAVVGGFGLRTTQFISSGLQQTAPVAAMFVLPSSTSA